ncbi:MAG TPA: hypothetical protein VG944_18125 [Fimbriimonas sp.]|nr:hypothetical protein [Fimbriimonas sp.]
MFKMRSSTKIFLIFCATVSVGWIGFNKIEDAMIMGQKFDPIAPGVINIVGINPVGYRVITANRVAQLVISNSTGMGTDQSSNESEEGGDDSGGAVKKKISVKDMLGVLQGNSESLSSFVMAMNDLNENDLPAVRVLWSKDRLEKALNGEPKLQAELERNLNVKLDGTPLSSLSVSALHDGIVVQIPVSVQVNLNNRPTTVTGQVLSPFKPQLMKAVENDVATKSNPDATMLAGYYKQEAEGLVKKPSRRENVRQELDDLLSARKEQELVDVPERLLKTAFVVVNDSFINDASHSQYTTPNGKTIYDLKIDLNDEGRRRLWQYSRRRVGDQILLTSNGVAIAVARIMHPLSDGEVTITHMEDESLLDDLEAALKQSKTKLAQR